MPFNTFSWTDIEEICIGLYEKYTDVDPLKVNFPELREMVETLEGFKPEPGQSVNEQILEAIQAGWYEEKMDATDDKDDDDQQGYQPNTPYR
ncbi:Fe-S cluster assembly protein IscX [Planctomycetota bacterium]|nr:Fe-S cluster assembly protein IscX [Planctomycetota bacterium]